MNINKHLSIFIVPHHGGKQKTIFLSKKKIKTILGISITAVLALAFILMDYFSLDVTRKKYKTLVGENAQMLTRVSDYKSHIEKQDLTIIRMQEYVRKLNVMAGLKSPDDLRAVGGVGSGPDSGQSIVPAVPSKSFDINRLENLEQTANLVEQNLSSILAHYQSESQKLASTPSIWPTRGYWSERYGMRDDPFTGKRTMHWGIDVATNVGNPIWASAAGRVISCSYGKTGGNTIMINHGGGITTVYCHLSEYKVKPGQKIKRGDIIGLVGRTGKATGPHLHYEVHVNGVRKNPILYILEE
ncbi:MAG: M23 family metallopeptidase [Acidobacteria bacterium]|nr:M23 family metallopeptidase [Acidobacteriota bacterium]MBU2438916.1 M23 family metallopeptidase [Acidobacteriota bacterium]